MNQNIIQYHLLLNEEDRKKPLPWKGDYSGQNKQNRKKRLFKKDIFQFRKHKIFF